MKYSIEGQTLTDLADAIRGKTGEIPGVSVIGSDNKTIERSTLNYSFSIARNKLPAVSKHTLWCFTFYYDAMDSGVIEIDETYQYPITTEVQKHYFSTESDSYYIGLSAMHPGVTKIVNINWTIEAVDENGNPTIAYGKNYTPQDMVEFIETLPPVPTEDDLTITDNCTGKFAYGGWNWFIDKYGNLMTTENVSGVEKLFYENKTIETVPFDFNCSNSKSMKVTQAFDGCYKLRELPRLYNVKPDNYEYLFRSCNDLREIPDDYFDTWDWSEVDNATNAYNYYSNNLFEGCNSLRKVPLEIFRHGNPLLNASYGIFKGTFKNCYALDEIVGLPNPHHKGTYNNSSVYSGIFSQDFVEYCYRLKNLTFAEMPPVNWALQTLDLSSSKYVGFLRGQTYISSITAHKSGITEDKLVKDDATYQALKNDPDWFTYKPEYSRYNHDSAVATINSLPSAIEYQTSSGKGANIIKFYGHSGASTDGGAINTLTEEEIAVAAAKGWTVSF